MPRHASSVDPDGKVPVDQFDEKLRINDKLNWVNGRLDTVKKHAENEHLSSFVTDLALDDQAVLRQESMRVSHRDAFMAIQWMHHQAIADHPIFGGQERWDSTSQTYLGDPPSA